MFDQRQFDPFILGSACPSSCALVKFALRLGGTIDPEFLLQCQIMDPKFQQDIDKLKAIPLNFEPLTTIYRQQDDMFLDIDAANTAHFYDPWEFKQHNTWIGSPNQWDSTYAINDDIIIDFI